MKTLFKIYHFLGSIQFALTLIGTVAIFSIAGTIIESKTESHLYASAFTFGHPLFAFILWCFFINILISALRRWPFKIRHIPFLITHFGLLMILAGVLIKNYYGIQGVMGILEGGTSNQIFEENTQVIQVESRSGLSEQFEFKRNILSSSPSSFLSKEGLKIELVDYSPNSEEILETWIKNNKAYILGFPPFQVYEWNNEKDNIPISGKVHLNPDDHQIWEIYAFKTSNPEKLIQNIQPKDFPALAIVKDSKDRIYLATYCAKENPHVIENNELDSIIIYDKGFAGYAVQAKIPNGKSSEQLILEHLTAELRKGLNNKNDLAPPLSAIADACTKCNLEMASSCVEFLSFWDKSKGWLYPTNFPLPSNLEKMFASLDFHYFSKDIQNACYWNSVLFADLEPALAEGKNIMEILNQKKWPLLQELKSEKSTNDLLTLLTRQIFAAGSLLPQEYDSNTLSPSQKARWLSVLLRAYQIHLATLIPPNFEIPKETITIESPLSAKRIAKIALKKIEENLPRITLKFTEGKDSQLISLTYNRFGKGLKWPILNGKYMVVFQPKFISLPYKIRLRQARQVNYPNSSQPYSYESDLIITELKTNFHEEKTISMNNVHETWDGYRFYLANMVDEEGTAKRIQLVVNHDPGKYWLTYLGAFTLSLGIVLLFWMKPYAKKI